MSPKLSSSSYTFQTRGCKKGLQQTLTGTEKVQDVASVKRYGVAYYKAISPAGIGKAPHSSLSEQHKEQRQCAFGRNPTKSRQMSVETSQFDTNTVSDFWL